MHAARRLATVAALAVVALTGCSDEPEPRFAEPTKSSSSPSTSTDDTEPRMAEQDLLQTFFSRISDSLDSGESSSWLELTVDCAQCDLLAENLQRAYRNGGRIEGGGWELIDAEYVGEVSLGVEWSVEVRTAEERWLDRNGDLRQTVRASRQQLAVALDRVDGRLVITGLRSES